MSYQTTYVELRTRYINGWTEPPTEYPNEKFIKPEPSALWARFHITDGSESQIDIGATQKSFRTHGVLTIQLFAPLNQGAIGILNMADTLAGVFRNWCGTTITCREASVRNIGNDGFGWYQVNVIIPFQTDVLH